MGSSAARAVSKKKLSCFRGEAVTKRCPSGFVGCLRGQAQLEHTFAPSTVLLPHFSVRGAGHTIPWHDHFGRCPLKES